VKHKENLQIFERLVLRHKDSAFNFARWFTRNQEEAKNLVQEALLRAFKSLDDFEGGAERVQLLRIVRDLRTGLASSRPAETVLADQVRSSPESRSSTEPLSLKNVDAQAVRLGMEGLAAELREVMVLRELEGLSYQEIAEVTETPLGTVLSRLAQARDTLWQNLTKALRSEAGKGGEQESQNAMPGKQ